MTYQIRPTRIPGDAPQVAALASLFEPDGVTAEEMIRNWSRLPEGGVRYRLVAELDSGDVVATGVAAHDPHDSPGRWFGGVRVHPEWQGRGIGSAMQADLTGFIRTQDGTMYSGELRDNDADALRWLQRRGGQIDRHLFESTLDLHTLAESQFAGVIERVTATGIRFLTLADEPGEENLRRLYNLVSRTVFDIPGWDTASFEPFADWRKPLEEQGSKPDLQWLALDGDRCVGTTALELREASGTMYTFHTSVDREYRGRGIALALKLLSVQTARRYGATLMRTHNDETNAPMLAINRKLGYQPEPGVYRVNLPL